MNKIVTNYFQTKVFCFVFVNIVQQMHIYMCILNCNSNNLYFNLLIFLFTIFISHLFFVVP